MKKYLLLGLFLIMGTAHAAHQVTAGESYSFDFDFSADPIQPDYDGFGFGFSTFEDQWEDGAQFGIRIWNEDKTNTPFQWVLENETGSDQIGFAALFVESITFTKGSLEFLVLTGDWDMKSLGFGFGRDQGMITTETLDFDAAAIEAARVSAVPVPAALVMFAPALLGFLGFRRKAKNSIA
jgi:hypothetical protein